MMRGWGSLTPAQFNKLYEATDAGDARFQHYDLFLQDTGWERSDETWQLWAEMAALALVKAKGTA